MSTVEAPRRTDAVTPLLVHQQQQQPRPDGDDRRDTDAGGEKGGSFSWLSVIGFLFLTFNSGVAIYRSEGDPWAIAFVVFSYADLALLFACLRMYDREEVGSPHRGHLRVAVWLLTTLLTAAFSYKVAAVMPMPVAALVWAMAFATVAGGYYAFFIHNEKSEHW